MNLNKFCRLFSWREWCKPRNRQISIMPWMWQSKKRVLSISRDEEAPFVYPYKQLPNVKEFKITGLGPLDPDFLKEGIIKRLHKAKIETTPYTNKRINRYLHHQFTRLNKHRGNPTLFWTIAWQLLTRSISYTVVSYNFVHFGWHRNRKLGDVWKEILKLEHLKRNLYQTVPYTRKWIPKDEQSDRPLGIPSPAWRVILHQMTQLFVVYLAPYQSKSQHGFWPNRGTDTAWQDIHSNVLRSENIYEYDFKKYFNSLNKTFLIECLEALQIPESVVSLVDLWNRSLPSNESKPLLWWESPQQEAETYKYYKTRQWGIKTHEELDHWLDQKRKAEQSTPEKAHYEYYYGVPQGFPTSPVISTIPLLFTLFQLDAKVVQYADDGILYDFKGSVQDILRFPPETGIKLNENKSRNIKIGGIWYWYLQFLGKRFIPKELPWLAQDSSAPTAQGGWFESNTRSLRSLVFDKYELINRKETSNMPRQYHDTSFDNWFKTKLYGFLSSRLYMGSWNTDLINQCFLYTYKEFSWSDLDTKRKSKTIIRNGLLENTEMTIFNSSSFACAYLAQRLKYHRSQLVRQN